MRKGGRTRVEWAGYREMGRVMTGMVPRTFFLEEEEGIEEGGEGGLMVVEFLKGFVPYADLLRRGREGGREGGGEGVPGQVARLLGRYHGMVMWNSAYETRESKDKFENEEHLLFWEERFVRPLMAVLRGGGGEGGREGGGVTKGYLAEELRGILKEEGGREGGVMWAVESLCREYRGRKEALVHADMHAMNILVKQGGREGGREGGYTVKIIDAEKSMWGPAGLDVGMFLGNFAFYLASEGEEGREEGREGGRWAEAMQEVWWVYEREFLRVQGGRGVEEGWTQEGLRGVFNDAVGYMGLWLLFLTVANPVVVLPLPGGEGRRDGGTEEEEGRHANVMRVAVAALRDYAKFWRRREEGGREGGGGLVGGGGGKGTNILGTGGGGGGKGGGGGGEGREGGRDGGREENDGCWASGDKRGREGGVEEASVWRTEPWALLRGSW